MALKAKHPHIRIDEKIWDDPVILALSPRTFKTYVFAIAWSKSQGGRTPNGLLTDHGIGRINASQEDLAELVASNLFEKCEEGYRILKYEDWQMTSDEERETQAAHERQVEYGRQGAAKRAARARAAVNPPEEGFDIDAAFEAAWENWPEQVDPRWREKREDAYEGFRSNITNSKDWAAFQAALMKRIRDYEHEQKPKAERRMFLGRFNNFCDERWKNWIPKSFRASDAKPEKLPDPGAEPQASAAPKVANVHYVDPEVEADLAAMG
jgi:hypothetical protein